MSTDAALEVLIQDEIKTAMKAKDREKLEALRSRQIVCSKDAAPGHTVHEFSTSQ